MSNAAQMPKDDRSADVDTLRKQLMRLERRLLRERRARKQAEDLLEERAHMLYDANERLEKLNGELEERVISRTKELEAARSRAVALAEQDQLTGLANRRSYLRQLEKILERACCKDYKVALFAIDIDHFKDINDTFGHPAGDALLNAVSDRLSDLARPSDLVARLGGDEFAILCKVKNDRDEIAFLADKVIDAIDAPILYDGKSLEVSCSVGVAISDGSTTTSQDLQRFADIALYYIKARGRGDWALYEDSMSEGVRQRKKLAHHLRVALESKEEELEVQYQPIIDLTTGLIVGVEALCRWHDPEMGSISPEIFIPVAEETSLIYSLGDYVLNRSCEELGGWLASSKAHLSINLSPKQLKDRNLIPRVKKALDANKVDPSRICFEVTETLFLWDISEAQRRLNELAALGVKIALDDFGTGFSNLNQLRLLPIDYLKIDRSFISDIEKDSKALSMVRAIFAVTRGVHISAIAEGVENQAQATLLRQAGADFVQGYHFSKALPAQDFIQFAKEKQTVMEQSFGFSI